MPECECGCEKGISILLYHSQWIWEEQIEIQKISIGQCLSLGYQTLTQWLACKWFTLNMIPGSFHREYRDEAGMENALVYLGSIIANNHKFGGLKQQKFILSQFWRSDSKIKMKVGPGAAMTPRLHDWIFPCLSQGLVSPGIPWFVVAYLQLLPACLHDFFPCVSALLCLW